MCDTQHKSINRTKIDRRIDKHFMQSYWSALHFAPTNLPVLYRGMPQASHGMSEWSWRFSTSSCLLNENLLSILAWRMFCNQDILQPPVFAEIQSKQLPSCYFGVVLSLLAGLSWKSQWRSEHNLSNGHPDATAPSLNAPWTMFNIWLLCSFFSSSVSIL